VASPHEVLGVEPDADERDVIEAYRRRAKEAHPDHGGTPEAFHRVKAAYEELMATDRPDGEASGDAPFDRRPTRSRPAGNGREPAPPATDVTVEYLDYEALSDHGWSLADEDLFEKAAAAAMDPGEFGRFVDDGDGSLLEAAEGCGFTWPYSCRGGACANCAVAMVEGDLEMPANHVLPDELYDKGIRLSCIGRPTTDEVRVVYNVKHLPDLKELLLPNHPFRG
jgi:curved DNA-binding protein CbpA